MSTPAWPDYAIAFEPLNDNLEQDPPDALLRSDFEQGMARQRRVFRNAPTTFNLQWAMTPEQFKLFKGFVRLVDGGSFTVPVFSDDDYVDVTAQFVKGSIKWTRSGGEWMVGATIETMDQLAAGEDDYALDLFAFGYDGTLDDLLDLFHDAVQDGFYEAIT